MAIKTYFAGSIEQSDWRHQIADLDDSRFNNIDQLLGKEPIEIKTMSESVSYVGPFFIGVGHGACHGPNSHGVDANEVGYGHTLTRGVFNLKRSVMEASVRRIADADAVFCVLDKSDAFGTLAELGVAKAMGKPVFLAVDPDWLATADGEKVHDLWFPITMATVRVDMRPIDAWRLFACFARWIVRRKPPGKSFDYLPTFVASYQFALSRREMIVVGGERWSDEGRKALGEAICEASMSTFDSFDGVSFPKKVSEGA